MLPYGRQLIEDDDVEAVAAQLRSDSLTQGPTVAKFEQALCAVTGAKHAVAVSSGTAALHLACLVAGVGSGDRGITSAITFVASANCVRYAGGKPFFTDVDPATGHMSLESLREVVRAGPAPKVIIPVDFSGSVADLEGVQAVARECGAKVIEDAAHSLGATYAGGRFRAGSCTHSDFAILSFHPVKHITTGEGGAILTNDATAFERLMMLRTHGITKEPARLTVQDEGPWYHEQQALGFHYRLNDLQCALGLSQLKKLNRFVTRRRALAARYDAAFADKRFQGALAPLQVPREVDSAYHLYVIRLLARAGETNAEVAVRRRAMFEGLRQKQIAPQVHYIPVYRQPDFKAAGLGAGSFPGADTYYSGCLSLPMFPAMRDEDVDEVVRAVGALL